MHWEDDGGDGNEVDNWVSFNTVFPGGGTNVDMFFSFRALITKFEFTPGVEGQVAIPIAAATMSAFDIQLFCFADTFYVGPKDCMPLKVRHVQFIASIHQ